MQPRTRHGWLPTRVATDTDRKFGSSKESSGNHNVIVLALMFKRKFEKAQQTPSSCQTNMPIPLVGNRIRQGVLAGEIDAASSLLRRPPRR